MSSHPIQKNILLKLSKKSNQKYSDLKIPDVENDLFNYHLQYLVKNRLVNKNGNGYSITDLGVKSILLTDATGKDYQGLRASVLVYVIDRKSEPLKILIQKRGRKPYINEVNAGIAGKILPAENVVNAASRKLSEETGLIGECKYIGTIRKTRISLKGEIDDAFFYVCVCESWKGELIKQTEYGKNYWGSREEAIQSQKSAKSSSIKSYEVLENMINRKYDLFFFEETVQVDSF